MEAAQIKLAIELIEGYQGYIRTIDSRKNRLCIGTFQDWERGCTILESLVKINHAEARYHLGKAKMWWAIVPYPFGGGIKIRDDFLKDATSHLIKSGLPDAQYFLGIKFFDLGNSPNVFLEHDHHDKISSRQLIIYREEGLYYLKLAAYANHTQAHFMLGSICESRMSADSVSEYNQYWFEVESHYSSAAQAGHIEAQVRLATHYLNFAKNYPESSEQYSKFKQLSLKFYRMSAEQGHKESVKILEKLESSSIDKLFQVPVKTEVEQKYDLEKRKLSRTTDISPTIKGESTLPAYNQSKKRVRDDSFCQTKTVDVENKQSHEKKLKLEELPDKDSIKQFDKQCRLKKRMKDLLLERLKNDELEEEEYNQGIQKIELYLEDPEKNGIKDDKDPLNVIIKVIVAEAHNHEALRSTKCMV